jgi:hypothetical protein
VSEGTKKPNLRPKLRFLSLSCPFDIVALISQTIHFILLFYFWKNVTRLFGQETDLMSHFFVGIEFFVVGILAIDSLGGCAGLYLRDRGEEYARDVSTPPRNWSGSHLYIALITVGKSDLARLLSNYYRQLRCFEIRLAADC